MVGLSTKEGVGGGRAVKAREGSSPVKAPAPTHGALMGTGPLTNRHFLLYSPSWSRGGTRPDRLCNLSKVTQPGSGRASSNPNPASSKTPILSPQL